MNIQEIYDITDIQNIIIDYTKDLEFFDNFETFISKEEYNKYDKSYGDDLEFNDIYNKVVNYENNYNKNRQLKLFQ